MTTRLIAAFKELGFRKAYLTWVSFGAVSGAGLSGFNKMIEISSESTPKYINPTFEIPIRAVYQTSRIAGHAGWGAIIGGLTAATAPISIPGYVWWMSEQKRLATEKLNQSEV